MVTPATTTLRMGDIAEGQALPPAEIPITPTLIVGGAIASRDFHPSHHDHHRARELGSPDIFMNIMTTNGLVGRWVTDWAGPEAILRSVNIRLGAPNRPGDTMRLEGSVTGLRRESVGDRGVVEVAFKGTNSIGDHVTGTLELNLPVRA